MQFPSLDFRDFRYNMMSGGAASASPFLAGAAVDIIFTTGQVFGGTLASLLSITNATGGYVTNADGTLTKFAANTLRIGVGTGLLVEESRINSCLQSQALATSPWQILSPGSVANNAAVAPDGTSTATSFTDTVSTNVFNVQQQSIAAGTGSGIVTAYLKAGSQSWGSIQIDDSGASKSSVAYFNLSGAGATGSITNLVSTGTISASAITALSNGWYRCQVAFNALALNSGTLFIGPASGDGGRSYLGTGAIAGYIWGVQVEAASATFATSYIPTTTSAVTRAADNVTGVLSNWSFNATTGTWLTSFTDQITFASTSRKMLFLSDGATSNFHAPAGQGNGSGSNAGTRYEGATVSGGLGQFAANLAAVAAGSHKIGYVYAANDYASSIDGGAAITQASGSLPAVAPTTLYVGRLSNNTQYANSYIKRVTYFATRQSNAALQVLTV